MAPLPMHRIKYVEILCVQYIRACVSACMYVCMHATVCVGGDN